ncbi:MAG: cardiolipin synthase [Clostridium sp.]|nr:cardiolipin synthase [Clostridium sp.]
MSLYENVPAIYVIQMALSAAVVCYIINKRDTNPAYKLIWTITILVIPIFGIFMYIFLHAQLGTFSFKNKKNQLIKFTKPLIPQDEAVMDKLKEESPYTANLAQYVNDYGCYPIYRNNYTEYYRIGEEKYISMLNELKKARKYIFMEYFIIDRGEMWDSILDILFQKASEGVEVRLIYDGMLSQFNLPSHYDRYLESKGIKCRVFNQFRPFLSTSQNNRDHRKILVIDGITAFNGGVNLADEYINEKERFGHWKDTAVMVKGEAAWSFAVMFIQMWERKTKQLESYEKYKPESVGESDSEKGYIMPYGDVPTDNENVGELIYLDIINKAKKYVYITTPYLILDNEMITALGFAAKSGVDIRIIIPHIADKWYAKCVGWNYYKELIMLGVKIYEYMPGFIHAKNFLSDDETATVGTINLDYRSLYLHFECGTFMYKVPAIADIRSDFKETLVKCRRITLKDCKSRSLIKRIGGGLLRIIAPLL